MVGEVLNRCDRVFYYKNETNGIKASDIKFDSLRMNNSDHW